MNRFLRPVSGRLAKNLEVGTVHMCTALEDVEELCLGVLCIAKLALTERFLIGSSRLELTQRPRIPRLFTNSRINAHNVSAAAGRTRCTRVTSDI